MSFNNRPNFMHVFPSVLIYFSKYILVCVYGGGDDCKDMDF